MKVAIIPARGGSKRIPGKNIKPFLGRPLISYSIAAALNSEVFERVIVSTDCERIAEVALECGAEVPFLRPAELADDVCPMGEVIDHAVAWLRDQGQPPEFICGLFATAPLVSVADIRNGLQILQHAPAFKTALAVTSFAFPIQRALRINTHGAVEMFNPEHALTRSQDLEPAYHDAGQFFWQRVGVDSVEGCKPVMIERYRVQDIDCEQDWAVAEVQYQVVQKMSEQQRETFDQL